MNDDKKEKEKHKEKSKVFSFIIRRSGCQIGFPMKEKKKAHWFIQNIPTGKLKQAFRLVL